MASIDWRLFKKYLNIPKLLKSGTPEVLIQKTDSGISISSSERRRVVKIEIPASDLVIPEGVQYSIAFDNPLLNENDVNSWNMVAKKDTLKFEFISDSGKKVTEIRKKAKPVAFNAPMVWELLQKFSKSDITRILDHLEASASVKDTKTEEDARINAIFFREDGSFSINRHTASVSKGVGEKRWSLPSLDFSSVRAFIDRCDSDQMIRFEDGKEYIRVGYENFWLYLTKVVSREPNFAFLEDKYLYEFNTTVDALKSIVKWSEYNADASSYLTLGFNQDECEFKTKYKTLGTIKGTNVGSVFEVSLPSKNFVNLVEYLSGKDVSLRFSHEKLNTIFNLHSIDGETGRLFDHYIQSVKM
jgi:hypothetical protein